MRFRILEAEVKQALSPSGLPDIDYALNPYLGCAHACAYCYAKMYTRVRSAANEWGSVVVVKKNLIDVLKREVRRVRRGTVGIGTITDPYQPIEAVYRLTRRCLEILTENMFRISIQTKSSLVLRDIDVLKAKRDAVDVGITITSTKNSSPINRLEPYSSPPSARIEALRRLSYEGIRTWIFYGPVIPGLNDSIEEAERIVRLARETNSVVYVDRLRIKKFMWSSPTLSTIARKSIEYPWDSFFKEVFSICRHFNVTCKPGLEYDNEEFVKRLDEFINGGALF